MVCHALLSFEGSSCEWENCDDSENCGMLVHHDMPAEEANTYPHEWMENFIGFHVRNSGAVEIFYHDTTGLPHRDNGPALMVRTGERRWYQHGDLHRLDGPAVELGDYTETGDFKREWWVDGKRHRDDGPAFVNGSNVTQWWVEGKNHRVDGPAVETSDRRKEWRINGKLHRDDNPAIIRSNGSREWWVDGKLHRLDGPAVEHADGRREWYENGVKWKEKRES